MADLTLRDLFGLFFLAGSVFFFFMGTLALVRFKDLYVRAHSTGLISILGLYSLILAALTLHHEMTLKVLVLGLLLFLMQPVASQVIAQAGYQAGVKPINAERDDLEGRMEIREDPIREPNSSHDEEIDD